MKALLAALVVLIGISFSAQAADSSANITLNFHSGMRSPSLSAEVWVPSGWDTIRGMLVLAPGMGGDTRYNCSSTYWQEPARAMGFGIIGWQDTSYFGVDTGQTAAEATSNFQSMMDLAASSLSHPEISNAPVAFYGFSKGGYTANNFAARVPDRTICFVSDKAGTWIGSWTASAKQMPGLFIVGSVDTVISPSSAGSGFTDWRSYGNAEVAQAIDWGAGHQGSDQDLILTHIAQSVKARYPAGQSPSATPGNPLTLNSVALSNGWYGQSNAISSSNVVTPIAWPNVALAANYTDSTTTASWLLNQTEAMVYQAHNQANPQVQMGLANPTSKGSYTVGQTICLGLNSALNPASITDVQVYYEDQLLADSASLLAGGSGQVQFTPNQIGVDTFITVVTYTQNGQTLQTSDYCTAVVVPEPATLSLLGLAMARKIRRRRKE